MGTAADQVDIIRALNDSFRTVQTQGKVLLSSGVAALATVDQSSILRAVVLFDDFTDDNDPYGEHDCAIITVDSYRVLWKIDYYDPTLQYHSEDPADQKKTVRIMTVMFPEEY